MEKYDPIHNTVAINLKEYALYQAIIEGLNFRSEMEYECPCCLESDTGFGIEHKYCCPLHELNKYRVNQTKTSDTVKNHIDP